VDGVAGPLSPPGEREAPRACRSPHL
jgi:hypothetical protein